MTEQELITNPLTVWLTPLSKFSSAFIVSVREISPNVVKLAKELLENINICKAKVADLENDDICKDFPGFKSKMTLFSRLADKFKENLQMRLSLALPEIRGGRTEEQSLLEMLSNIEQSPFGIHLPQNWVNCKAKEMNAVTSYKKGFASIRLIRSNEELDNLVKDFSTDYVLCFCFTSIGQEDPYLRAMSRFLDEQAQEQESYTCQKEWYDDASKTKIMRVLARQFKDFALSNMSNENTVCVITGLSIVKENTQGGTICLYEHGNLTEKEFHLPCAPGKPVITEHKHDTVSMTWAQPSGWNCSDEGALHVKSYILKYREKKDGAGDWNELRTDSTTTEGTVYGLKSNTTYEFSVAAECEVGVSSVSPVAVSSTAVESYHQSTISQGSVAYREASLEGDQCDSGPITGSAKTATELIKTYEKTLCTSFLDIVPEMPKILTLYHDSVTVTWSHTKMNSSRIRGYLIRYRSTSKKDIKWKEIKTLDTNTSAHVPDLRPNTSYEFRVASYSDTSVGQYSPTSDIFTTRGASPPAKVWKENETDTSITVAWNVPVDVSDDTAIHGYRVKYIQTNQTHATGQQNALFTEIREASRSCTINDLNPNANYTISICALCNTGGESIYSEPIQVDTAKEFKAPGKPNVVKITHDKVELEWTEAHESGGQIKFYQVQFKEKSEKEVSWIKTKCEYRETSATIDKLKPNTAYQFVVCACYAYDRNILGPESEVCTTLAASPPVSVRKETVSDTSITLSWDQPDAMGEGIAIRGYNVAYSSTDDTPGQEEIDKNIGGPSCTGTIICLKPDTKYMVTVCVLCSPVGKSIPSNPVQIATAKQFKPPGKPDMKEIKYNAVDIKWTHPVESRVYVKYYRVRYREFQQTSWTEYKETCLDDNASIGALQPNTAYQFEVVAYYSDERIFTSATSDAFTTLPASPPTNVRPKVISSRSCTITWDKPSAVGKHRNVKQYKITYSLEEEGDSEHCGFTKAGKDALSFTIEDLAPETRYNVRVCAVCNEVGEGAFSEPTCITTKSRIAPKLVQGFELMPTNTSDKVKKSFKTYRVPLNGAANSSQMRKYQTLYFGTRLKINSPHVVIMVVGATGAGKSTLINGMINYIFQVEWTDNFRFKIITDHGENLSQGQDQSQTEIITSYTIYPPEGSELKYTLTIIDTPGFGDTRGIDRDKFIVEQIREFFHNSSTHHIDHVNAIGFVAQASLARLTHTQKYVFDSILAIFGKDIEKNILLLITFADGQEPPVMNAIQKAGLPCSDEIMFKFNNSGLFANNTATTGLSFDHMFWEMGVQSMKAFFNALAQIDVASLTLTKEVLAERKRLEVAVEGVQIQVQEACGKLDELRDEQNILEEHQAKIEANKDFVYFVDVQKYRTIPIVDQFITNCSKCHFTCHDPCYIADDKKKMNCAAMGPDKNCEVCPGKCVWSVHHNNGYRFEFYTEKEERTFKNLEERYNEATNEKLTVEQIISKHKEELTVVQDCVFVLITEAHKSLIRLEEIALRQNPLSTVDYVDLLIEAESLERKPGWKARTASLKKVRKEAELMQTLLSPNWDPSKVIPGWEEYTSEDIRKKKEFMEQMAKSNASPFERYIREFGGKKEKKGLWTRMWDYAKSIYPLKNK